VINGRKIRSAAAIVGIGALALGATGAEAWKQVKTKVKIDRISSSGAKGTVSAKDAKCVKNRKVTLLLIGEYSDTKVGKAFANKKGKWKVGEALEPGFYYAKAPQLKAGSKTCAAAESKNVRF
jgi:hypothetical protein